MIWTPLSKLVLAVFLVSSIVACSGVGPFGAAPENTLVVTPESAVLGAVGSSVQLQILGVEAEGEPATIRWSSSNPSVVDVNENGIATAMGDGTTTITARVGGLTGTVTITVEATILHTIRITASDQADANTLNNTAAAAITVQAN